MIIDVHTTVTPHYFHACCLYDGEGATSLEGELWAYLCPAHEAIMWRVYHQIVPEEPTRPPLLVDGRALLHALYNPAYFKRPV